MTRTLAIAGVLGFALVGFASAQTLPAPVAAALKAAKVPSASAAVFVQEVGSSRAAVSFHSAQAMNPASTMKLVTTFAALELLGPVFTWKTEAYAVGSMQADVLEGDLVLRGSGDPKLTVENLWLMVRNLRARGLRVIAGDLVLDRSVFASADADPGRFDNEPLKPYNVAPDALLVNFKAFRFTFVPEAEGNLAQVLVEPRSALLEVVQSVRIGAGPCNDWRSRLKADFQSNGKGARASFAGVYPASCGEKTWNVALLPHAQYAYGVFRQLWEESGGTLKGGVREGPVPAGARLIYTHESPSLAEVVRDINKFSNNVMARQLFLTLAAEVLKQPATSEGAAQVIQSWLAQRGLAIPELALENGSGLSRQERISAGNLGRLLLAAWSSAVMPEFIASMPLVAYDGTMRRRLKFESIAGQAHIKTGSLADVRSMAGYVLDRSGRRFAVVFFVNHANAGAAQGAMDALLKWVYEGRGQVLP
ncbi:MAG: D-alanyl-D-alanine carboxypeptidase/D-alanyl-D-alanine-endopeptidase [Betaproteobacteria bacterium]|nr:D-alanyl-D-alanine carboxypeptidase/D-alanyl-D-alanine-endopeptidase [Betaproteobacteria bacterium]